MAREWVLVQKPKYEQLLKTVEHISQSGGQTDLKDANKEIDSQSTSPPISSAMEDVASLPNEGDMQSTEQTTSTKPTLFVEKPLSKMKFHQKQSVQQSRRVKKRKWINYTV